MTGGLIIPVREKLYGEVATRNHQGPIFQGGQVLGAGINLATGLANPCKLAPIATTGLKALNGAQAVGSAVDAVDSYQKGDYGNAALNALNALFSIAQLGRTCFAAGTPLLTPHGPKPIEEFQVDDPIESRHEDDPDGPVVTRRVVNLFRNYSPLLDVHVGGQVIRTTAEHPFWVVGRGWTDAQQLNVGDLLLGAEGEQTSVEAIDGPKESAPVYNLEVEEYHTYLVGGGFWGFSVWAHNTKCGGSAPNTVPAKSNTVFRGLAEGENPAAGLTARAPGAGNSVASHVGGKKASQWISTTTDEAVARGRFGANGVVEIDLSKVGSEVVDLSNGIPGMMKGMLSNWARKMKEVLVKDFIPPEAIKKLD